MDFYCLTHISNGNRRIFALEGWSCHVTWPLPALSVIVVDGVYLKEMNRTEG